ncbi:response regulator transcription factor [Novosphingobium sp. BL-52-GroH]|uniref:response regulator transcription factor n=1 Tax=Novosphingobium sp. BL-52-GroH TaxID=3349877 RepID=UPI00384D0FD9
MFIILSGMRDAVIANDKPKQGVTGGTMQENSELELTARENEVVVHVASGMSAKEIAIRLRISRCTVERHVENVRLKTRTRNRVHMVAYVLQTGLLRSLIDRHRTNLVA